MTDDFSAEKANNYAAISKLEEMVRKLQAHHERMIENLSNPTEEMMLAEALAHSAGLRSLRAAITAGRPKTSLWR